LFIVTEDWMKDSTEAGKWVNEEKYEATKYFTGAKKMRQSHNQANGMLIIPIFDYRLICREGT
jgi:hypothetical protein